MTTQPINYRRLAAQYATAAHEAPDLVARAHAAGKADVYARLATWECVNLDSIFTAAQIVLELDADPLRCARARGQLEAIQFVEQVEQHANVR